MKKHFLPFALLLFFAGIILLKAQKPTPVIIELHCDYSYLHSLKDGVLRPDSLISSAQLNQITSGNAIVYLCVDNPPPGFDRLGKIKRNTKLSSVYAAFNITPYIIEKYTPAKNTDVTTIIIDMQDGRKVKIKVNAKAKKGRNDDWDEK